jgi:hypothetical protein
MAITIGGLTFPLPAPAPGVSLLATCDPFADALLPYFRALIRHYCSAAFAAASAAPAESALFPQACETVSNVSAETRFRGSKPQLPLLCLYPVRARDGGAETMGLVSDAVEYRLEYVLPQLNPEQEERVLPLLPAVRLLLVAAIYAAVDTSVAGPADVLNRAGISQLECSDAEFTEFLGAAHRLPMLSMKLIATFQSRPDLSAGALLTSVTTSLDVGGEADANDDGELLPGAVSFKVTP